MNILINLAIGLTIILAIWYFLKLPKMHINSLTQTLCYSQNQDSLILLLVGKLNFQSVEF